jgi:hypothetical protein
MSLRKVAEGDRTGEGDMNSMMCFPKPPAINASGGQEPFCKRVPGPPKTFANKKLLEVEDKI